jgi:hypothetical protein
MAASTAEGAGGMAEGAGGMAADHIICNPAFCAMERT